MQTESFLNRPASAVEPPALGGGPRYPSIDIARGIIMIVMALDHASVAWNSGRAMPEVVGLGPIDYGHWTQQFTREITHVCAPGFQLLAGMGLSISVWRRQRAGKSQLSISADMALRGLALLFCDFVLMYQAYDRVPFFFLVLACIGSCTILFSVLRRLPLGLILLFAVAVILCGPLYAKGHAVAPSAGAYVYNVLANVALPTEWPPPPQQRSFLVLYPIFPWIGCFALGWFLGALYERRIAGIMQGERREIAGLNEPRKAAVDRSEAEGRHLDERSAFVRFAWLLPLGAALIVAAFLFRWFAGSYFDPHPTGDGPSSAAFWTVSKYPPSPVFLLATVGTMLALLSLLRPLDRPSIPPWRRGKETAEVGAIWRIPRVFGQVSLFFFIVHMYLYFAYPHATGTAKTYSLATTYVVWLCGLVVMFPLCLLYRNLRNRHRTVLRYF